MTGTRKTFLHVRHHQKVPQALCYHHRVTRFCFQHDGNEDRHPSDPVQHAGLLFSKVMVYEFESRSEAELTV